MVRLFAGLLLICPGALSAGGAPAPEAPPLHVSVIEAVPVALGPGNIVVSYPETVSLSDALDMVERMGLTAEPLTRDWTGRLAVLSAPGAEGTAAAALRVMTGARIDLIVQSAEARPVADALPGVLYPQGLRGGH